MVEGPLLAGLRVVTADKGGRIRESLAMGKVYAEARKQEGESELLEALVTSQPALDQERARAAGDVGTAVREGLGEGLRPEGEGHAGGGRGVQALRGGCGRGRGEGA